MSGSPEYTALSTGLDAGTLAFTVSATEFDLVLGGGPVQHFLAGEPETVTTRDGGRVTLTFGLDFVGEALWGTLRVSGDPLRLQTGPDAGEYTSMWVDSYAASVLGTGLEDTSFASVANIDLREPGGAADAIRVADAAIDQLSRGRSALGTFQSNELEPLLADARFAVENLSAAESTIADTDMALEMTRVVREQLRVQGAAQALDASFDLAARTLNVLFGSAQDR